MIKIVAFILSLIFCVVSYAQTSIDTSKSNELKEVIIKSWQRRDITRLPDEQNGFLNSGKKSEVITLVNFGFKK